MASYGGREGGGEGEREEGGMGGREGGREVGGRTQGKVKEKYYHGTQHSFKWYYTCVFGDTSPYRCFVEARNIAFRTKSNKSICP